MAEVEIYNQIAKEVADALSLTVNREVNLAPTIRPLKSMKQLEVQIADGPGNVVDHDGNVLRYDFRVRVGIFRKMSLDRRSGHHRALADTTDSINKTKWTIISALDGSFLDSTGNTDNLLERPLSLVGETACNESREVSGLLIKVISFQGGINLALPL